MSDHGRLRPPHSGIGCGVDTAVSLVKDSPHVRHIARAPIRIAVGAIVLAPGHVKYSRALRRALAACIPSCLPPAAPSGPSGTTVTLVSITPNTGTTLGGTVVTISGSEFHGRRVGDFWRRAGRLGDHREPDTNHGDDRATRIRCRGRGDRSADGRRCAGCLHLRRPGRSGEHAARDHHAHGAGQAEQRTDSSRTCRKRST